MLSDIQLASVVGSNVPWLYNSSRQLSRPLAKTVADARWWRLVRLIHAEVGLPLRSAGAIADAAIRPGASASRLRLNATPDGAILLQLDLGRFLSTFGAALASALAFSQGSPRGRPRKRAVLSPISATPSPAPSGRFSAALRSLAGHHVEFTVLGETGGVLQLSYSPAPKNIERLALLLSAWEAYPRGIDTGLPFIMDAATLRAIPKLPLRTNEGDLDLHPQS